MKKRQWSDNEQQVKATWATLVPVTWARFLKTNRRGGWRGWSGKNSTILLFHPEIQSNWVKVVKRFFFFFFWKWAACFCSCVPVYSNNCLLTYRSLIFLCSYTQSTLRSLFAHTVGKHFVSEAEHMFSEASTSGQSASMCRSSLTGQSVKRNSRFVLQATFKTHSHD